MTTRTEHLYIHVPFCRSICYYCDFCHRLYDEKIADRWLDALQKEIEGNCKDSYKTIYIGGGTPTSLSLSQLERLFRLVEPYGDECEEYTIEANPESLDEDKIALFERYGINRVSMGVQSSDDEMLKSLNRHHSFEDVKNAIDSLKKNGICNISVDLMYSLPGQDMKMLQTSIDDILSLDVEHISLYSLTIEDNTVFKAKGIQPLDIEIEADMYEMIVKKLTENGYIHYEVSNFCKPGYESRHNLGYWHYDNFLGLSLNASSKIGCLRWTNTSSFKEYFSMQDIKKDVIGLDKADMMFENVMMSLRLSEGIDIASFNKRYDCDILEVYGKGAANHNIIVSDGRLICTNLEILNSVLLDFME